MYGKWIGKYNLSIFRIHEAFGFKGFCFKKMRKRVSDAIELVVSTLILLYHRLKIWNIIQLFASKNNTLRFLPKTTHLAGFLGTIFMNMHFLGRFHVEFPGSDSSLGKLNGRDSTVHGLSRLSIIPSTPMINSLDSLKL